MVDEIGKRKLKNQNWFKRPLGPVLVFARS
jgi:hypothetical protein